MVRPVIYLTCRLQWITIPFSFASFFLRSFSATRSRKSCRQRECFTCSTRTLMRFARIRPLHQSTHHITTLSQLDLNVYYIKGSNMDSHIQFLPHVSSALHLVIGNCLSATLSSNVNKTHLQSCSFHHTVDQRCTP